MKNASLLLFAILFLSACSKKQIDKKIDLANPFYEKAFEYMALEKTTIAFKYFNKAKELFILNNDSLGIAKCLANMGYIFTLKSDFSSAQEYSLQALNFFNKNIDSQFVNISANYNNLGKATYQLKGYNNSIKFYDSALVYSKNPAYTRITLNNKAKTYQEIEDYDKALKIYDEVLKETVTGSKEYAMTLTNVALTKWLQDVNYNAVPSYLTALHIREKENDLWGQNSSYVHLAEFYTDPKPDSALFYSKKAYQVAKKLNSPNDQLYALQLLIKLSDPVTTKNYFEIYISLDDSVQTAINSDKNQFALVRYDYQKSRAENLQLQKENTDKKYQIIKREIVLFGTLSIVISLAVFAIFWYKKRKQNLLLETQNAIKESKLKTSKKVHDVVANGLYRVMTEIGNQDVIDKENVLDKIEVLYEKSRDISYEETTTHEEKFHEKIAELIKSFATESTKILLVGNTADLWLKVNTIAKFEIEHVLQELMVNMKKHSQANNVVFRFEQEADLINIYYIDNGIGMPKGVNYKNGLTNTGNRIESINGTITFDHKVEKGLRVQISFPLA